MHACMHAHGAAHQDVHELVHEGLQVSAELAREVADREAAERRPPGLWISPLVPARGNRAFREFRTLVCTPRKRIIRILQMY